MTRENLMLSNQYLILGLLAHIIKSLPKEKNTVSFTRSELLQAIFNNQQETARHMTIEGPEP